MSPDQELLHFLLTDSSDKGGADGPLMQMSKAWVEDRAKREDLPPGVAKSLSERNAMNFARRTVLVTFESTGTLDHALALADVHLGKLGDELHQHTEHGISREWGPAAIDAVEKARNAAHEAKKQSAVPRAEPNEQPSKKAKSRGR